jgi:hypothetical protein
MTSDSFMTYLFSYKSVESKAENVSGLISLFSFSLYKLQCIFSVWSRVSTSLANPVKPTISLSVTSKTCQ